MIRPRWLRRHPGIEGEYDEIVAWMDAHPVKGIGHNRPDRGIVQFGLFTLVHMITAKGRWSCSFSQPLPANCVGFPKTPAHLAGKESHP